MKPRKKWEPRYRFGGGLYDPPLDLGTRNHWNAPKNKLKKGKKK